MGREADTTGAGLGAGCLANRWRKQIEREISFP